jgi:hypothetical protein
MSFDLRKLQPDLPSFSWEGKDYIATSKIFYPATRIKYAEIIRNNITTQRLLTEAQNKLDGKLKGKKKEVEKQQINIHADIDKLTERIKSANEETFDFLDEIFPGTKEANLFADDSPLPQYAQDGLSHWVACQIMGLPYIPPDLKFSHKDAEAMLDYLVKEKAVKEHQTTDEMYAFVKGQVFGKR